MCIRIHVEHLYKLSHIMHKDTFGFLTPKEQGCIHDMKELIKNTHTHTYTRLQSVA